MQKLSACRNRSSEIQRFSSTRMRCMTAIWPAGPPKLRLATFSQTRNASLSDGNAPLSRIGRAGGDKTSSAEIGLTGDIMRPWVGKERTRFFGCRLVGRSLPHGDEKIELRQVCQAPRAQLGSV